MSANDNRKRRNTAVFVLVATLLNILCMVVLFVGGLVLLGAIIPHMENPDKVFTYGVLAVMIFSLAFSWILYSFAVKKYMAKHNAQENFAPIFGRRNKNV